MLIYFSFCFLFVVWNANVYKNENENFANANTVACMHVVVKVLAFLKCNNNHWVNMKWIHWHKILIITLFAKVFFC